jgi:uncharacterized membrane protein YphA (DoxX/SURF4 family)
MNVLLWILQVMFAVYFLFVGVMHFIIPPGLPAPMSWMYELSTPLHIVSGSAEILGALGLVLPSATRIRPRLTVYAALGLAAVMVLAAFYHVTRGELQNVPLNLLIAAVLGFIAYGRGRLAPISAKPPAS